MGKLKINVEGFLPRLSHVVDVVNSKNLLPILGDVLFDAQKVGENSYLSLTSSDGETWLTVLATCVNVDEDMKFCLAAADIHRALANLKGEDVEIELDKSAHVAKCTYSNGRFLLPYKDAGEYPCPSVPDDNVTTKELQAANLQRAIEKTGFAVGNDVLRPVMNGIHFDFTQTGMVSVATNGQKLAKYTDTTLVLSEDEQESGYTLPKKPANILLGLLNAYSGNISIRFSDNCVKYANNNDFVLTTRLIDGNYPRYNSAIPHDNQIVATVNKSEMIAALKRVMPMGNEQSELVITEFTLGVLKISAENPDFNKSANEEIACDYNSPELTIAFKGSMLISVLQNIDGEQVRISLKEPSRAGLFESAIPAANSECIFLLMPLLIR